MEPSGSPLCGTFSSFEPIPFEVNVPEKGNISFIILRPDDERVRATADRAKQAFVEAFETNYTRFYNESKSEVSIEQWLRLKSGVTVREWLSETFDEEYQEYKAGAKGFIYLCDCQDNLVGWLSHGQVDEKGDLYLSQCSIEAEWRNQKVSTTAFSQVLNNNQLSTLFPEVKEVKLIVRKVNTLAQQLYSRAGFTRDETINPENYGASYDDRYVGYRLPLKA